MFTDEKLAEKYKFLHQYTNPVKKAEREIVGREKEMRSILSAFNRAEITNVLLLGEPGSGKTAVIQGIMLKDTERIYLEVDLAKMIADLNDTNEMAARLKMLFDETEKYSKTEGKELVLFIDEFHQIVQLSSAAVEALKPLLADSGTRGIRVVVATTYTEFRQYISSNQPLVERLQRINLSEPNKATVIEILKGMAKRYGVYDAIREDSLFEMIYDYTNRYIPANAQPRKSILILDAMVGWHRSEGRPFDVSLLADVIYDSEGVNIAFRVDATSIKKKLDNAVFSQDYATSAIESRLQICVADLNNDTRPMSSFLFSGASGVGKTEVTKQLAKILFGDEQRHLVRLDMSEYANPDSLERFRAELTTKVWERPYCIVLLDEIEKSCAPVVKLLLQVLDDGRLLDVNNREVSFNNAYIIMTTNAGHEVYEIIAQYNADDKGSKANITKYDKLIRRSLMSTVGDNKFPPELLGRIDMIIPFQPLSEATMRKIVSKKISDLVANVKKKHNKKLMVHKKVIDYLIQEKGDTDSNAGGARAVIKNLESEVVVEVARYINTHPRVNTVYVYAEGEMMSENKNQLESKAYIKVSDH